MSSISLYGYQDKGSISKKIEKITNTKGLTSKNKVQKIHNYLINSNLRLNDSEVGNYFYETAKNFYKKDLNYAILLIKKAIVIQNNKEKKDLLAIKKSLLLLGVFYGRCDDYVNGIVTFRKLLTVGREEYYHGRAYQQLSAIYSDLGDFEKATEYINKTIQIFERENVQKEKLIKAYQEKVYNFLQMNSLKYESDVLESLQKAETLTDFLEDKSRMNSYTIINLRRGRFFYRKKEYQTSKTYFKKALITAKKTKNDKRINEIQNNLGIANFKLQNYDEALNYFRPLIEDTEVIDINTKSDVYNNLGDYYFQKSDLMKAEQVYLKSVNIFTKNSKTPTLAELELLPNKPDIRNLLEQTTDFYYKCYQLTKDVSYLEKSLTYIKLTDAVIDMIRFENTEVKSKLYWRTKSKDLYIKGVRIAYLLNQPKTAFYFMEKSKVLLLLEDISDVQAKTLGNIPEDLHIKDIAFRKLIANIENTLLEASGRKADSIKNILFDLKRQSEIFKDSLKTVFPKYAQLRKNIPIIDIPNIPKYILNDQTAILSYILNDNEGYGVVVTNTGAKIVQLHGPKEIKSLLDTLRFKMTHPFFQNQEFRDFNEDAVKAYQLLVKDTEDFIKDKIRLIVVPDESIATFPFEVLQLTKTKNPTQPNYLLHHYNTSYAYSISHLKTRYDLDYTSKGVLGIMPTKFQTDGLADLNYSKNEKQILEELFSASILDDERATKQNSITSMTDHSIVHIASHANYDNQNNTWLWLYDDKLSYNELHSFKIHANLVMLAACKTLQGKEEKGEGIMSLTRGFFGAGAKSLVASLWDSNDKSVANISSEFYKHIKEIKPKDEALSLAKKTYISSNLGSEVSPYYWASMILAGDVASLDANALNPQTHLYSYIGIGFLLLLIFFFIQKRKS